MSKSISICYLSKKQHTGRDGRPS